ncbi:DNA mismatch endonuclease Vsr [soil metagenome]
MADVHSKAVRSYNMSRIKGRDTIPELTVRKFLHSKGLRFRVHVNHPPGKPDIVLPKYKTLIFVHGCFWHAHKNCRFATIPKTRTEWWQEKIQKNFDNDRKVYKELKNLGWKIITIWGCELKNQKVEATLSKLLKKFL